MSLIIWAVLAYLALCWCIPAVTSLARDRWAEIQADIDAILDDDMTGERDARLRVDVLDDGSWGVL